MDRLDAMQVFVRVVETGSFSKAAAEFQTTQPTVTKQVAALEARLKVRLLNRNTRGVSLSEPGALFYERCKQLLQDADSAAVRAAQSEAQGTLRIGTSVAFGRRAVVPLTLEFMALHPQIRVDLSFEDRYVDLIAQGIDVALRMGKLADSSLGARYLGNNPWTIVASPKYLKTAGTPKRPIDLARHNALVYSSVQGDDVWHFTGPRGERIAARVQGRLRSNNLSAVLAACREGLGVAALPRYVAAESLRTGKVVEVLKDFSQPDQELHAVFPSPKRVSAKVLAFVSFAQGRFVDGWWNARSSEGK
jgi:DNA-binding transcriptional LysR family regulator